MPLLEPLSAANRLLVALDTADAAEAKHVVRALDGTGVGFKLGLEIITSLGLGRALEIVGPDHGPIFVDLKLPNDIPTTVERTVAVCARAGADFLSFSPGATAETLAAANSGRGRDSALKFLLVIALSSDPQGPVDWREVQRTAWFHPVDGFVASGGAVADARRDFPGVLLVVPGIRSGTGNSDDHHRALSPRQAVAAGADFLVVGRPITQAADPRVAAAWFERETFKGWDDRGRR